jgi:hypothetical protein
MLIDTRASRDELRQTLSDAIDEQTAADASLVAVRAIGYRPQQIEAAEFQMVPFVWAEWLPTEGWYLATDRSRDSLHGLYFYHGVAPEW